MSSQRAKQFYPLPGVNPKTGPSGVGFLFACEKGILVYCVSFVTFFMFGGDSEIVKRGSLNNDFHSRRLLKADLLYGIKIQAGGFREAGHGKITQHCGIGVVAV